jgi:hypothetical protein
MQKRFKLLTRKTRYNLELNVDPFFKLNLVGVSLKGLVDMFVLSKEYSMILDKKAAKCRLHKVTKDYNKKLMVGGRSHIRLEILLMTTTFRLSF